MTNVNPAWPLKCRDILHNTFDSRYWEQFDFRTDDIVIVTYAKSGTTWMQQIVSQLIFNGAEGLNVHRLSPWYDFRHYPPDVRLAFDAQTHRRFVKTHLPVDALVFSPDAKYIYIGRDGRDAAWSFHNHHINLTDEMFQQLNSGMPEGSPPFERGTLDPYEFYKLWLARDGFPVWPFWSQVKSWWEIRQLPNVLLIHFNDMKADLGGVVRHVAQFLDISIDEGRFPAILEQCSFDYMKAHAADVTPRGGVHFKGGPGTFINKGSNGRWRERLTAEDVATYEARALAELGGSCARWLEQGGDLT
jgi:aryl sulfotransferase